MDGVDGGIGLELAHALKYFVPGPRQDFAVVLLQAPPRLDVVQIDDAGISFLVAD